MSKKEKRKRKMAFLPLFLLLVIAGTLLYSRYIEPYALQKTEVAFTSDKLTASTREQEAADSKKGISADSETHDSFIKIAVFADTHFSQYYTPDNFANVIDEINSESPDFIFFLGDLIDDYSTYTGDIQEIENELSSLSAACGKFAVFGNHDYGGNMEFRYPSLMENAGFTLLVNETFEYPSLNLTILGIDDMLIGYGNPDSAQQLPQDTCNIVLCHEPDIINDLLNYDIDYMFSGHTHGRQIDLKIFDRFIQPTYGKEYIKGTFDFNNERQTVLDVTAGIGMTKLPLRFGTPPEFNIITINGK